MIMTATEKYIRDVRRLITVYGKNEKKFIANLRNDLISYCDAHPETSDYDSITKEFGSPRDMYVHYLESQDDRYLVHSTRRHIIIRRTLLLLCIGVTVIVVLFGYHYQQANRRFRDSLPASYSETIHINSSSTESPAEESDALHP